MVIKTSFEMLKFWYCSDWNIDPQTNGYWFENFFNLFRFYPDVMGKLPGVFENFNEYLSLLRLRDPGLIHFDADNHTLLSFYGKET